MYRAGRDNGGGYMSAVPERHYTKGQDKCLEELPSVPLRRSASLESEAM